MCLCHIQKIDSLSLYPIATIASNLVLLLPINSYEFKKNGNSIEMIKNMVDTNNKIKITKLVNKLFVDFFCDPK